MRAFILVALCGCGSLDALDVTTRGAEDLAGATSDLSHADFAVDHADLAVDHADASDGDHADAAPDLPFVAGDLRFVAADMPLVAADMLDSCQAVTVSTLVGNGSFGFLDGPASVALVNLPIGVAVDSSGTFYVADFGNCRVRKVTPDGTTSTLAGNGSCIFMDGTGGANGTTSFNTPVALAVDAAGNVYVADSATQRVRKVSPDGTTITLAGNGTNGFMDGSPSSNVELNTPHGIAVDNLGFVYASDALNNRIRKIAVSNGATTTLAGNGTSGITDGTGGPSGSAEFNTPEGLAIDGSGNLFVADFNGNRLRKVAPDGTTSTLAGNAMELSGPSSVARDPAGNSYVSDTNNNRIRKVAPDGTTVTLAGGISGFQDGNGCTAQLKAPRGMALFGKLLYVADYENSRIRVIHLP